MTATGKYEDRRVYWVWLSLVFGAGNPALWQLCRGYGHIYDFAADLKNGVLDGRLTEPQRRKCGIPYERAAEIIEECENAGISVLSFRSEGYPEKLRRIPSPPAVLFVRGDQSVTAAGRPAVLFVGTRTPTAYSVRAAERLAGELAERGVTVISGLENGIDAVACEAASEKGAAAAVCGRGILSSAYTPEQMDKAAASGAVMAEYTRQEDFGRVPFDKRNRLMCGLADAVLFIECRSDSSGLNNAVHAQRMGRPVLAVPPADIFDSRFFGQTGLLRAGAAPVYSADDILSALSGGRGVILPGKELPSARAKAEKTASAASSGGKKVTKAGINTKNEQKIAGEGLHKSEMSATIDMSGFSQAQKKLCEILGASEEPVHINRLAELSDMDMPELMDELMMLRLEGAVTELSGKRYIIG